MGSMSEPSLKPVEAYRVMELQVKGFSSCYGSTASFALRSLPHQFSPVKGKDKTSPHWVHLWSLSDTHAFFLPSSSCLKAQPVLSAPSPSHRFVLTPCGSPRPAVSQKDLGALLPPLSLVADWSGLSMPLGVHLIVGVEGSFLPVNS